MAVFLNTFVTTPIQIALAATNTYDLATDTNWNIRIDGAASNDLLGINTAVTGDFDNNGKDDVIVISPNTDFNSLSNSGSVYIIYDTLLSSLTSTGNILDLNDSSNWNLRIDGPVATSFLGTLISPLFVADTNNNEKDDLLIGVRGADYNSRTDSGSVYILNDSLLDDYSGTGNTLHLAESSDFNLRIDGASSTEVLSSSAGITAGDLTNDGKDELVIPAQSDNNSRNDSGSVYILNNDLITTTTTTGQTLDLSSTYTLRIDGAGASDFLGTANGSVVGDFNNNGTGDLIVSANGTDHVASASGSVYFIGDSLLNVSDSNQTLDLATTSNYNLRIDGSAANVGLGKFHYLGDLDNNEYLDYAVLSSSLATNATGSGSMWIITDNILRDYYDSTGNTLNIGTSTSYNLRIDGAAASDQLGSGGFNISNYFGTGKDIIIGANLADSNGDGSGTAWVISTSIYSSLLESTGNLLEMSDSNDYTIRYDGASSGVRLITSPYGRGDFNNDGLSDYLVASYSTGFNSRTSSGSVYVIYNFPHSLNLNSMDATVSSVSQTVSGSISATNSVTTVSDVQWSLSNRPTGTWTSCTASDGGFNSRSEEFSCTVTLNSGSNTVYVRAKDTNGAYTAQASYATKAVIFSRETTTPSPSASSSSESSSTATPTATPTPVTPSVSLTKLGGTILKKHPTKFTYYGQLPIFEGAGTSDAEVTVKGKKKDGEEKTLCTTKVASEKWSCKSTKLEYGEYTITISATNNNLTTPLTIFTLVSTEPVPSPSPSNETVTETTLAPSPAVTESSTTVSAPYTAEIIKKDDGTQVLSVLRMVVTNSNKQPLAHQVVTLHSNPQTVTTDSNGIATFYNVPTGNHTLEYTTEGNKKVAVALSLAVNEEGGKPTTVTIELQPLTVPLPFFTSATRPILISILMLPALLYMFWLVYQEFAHRAKVQLATESNFH